MHLNRPLHCPFLGQNLGDLQYKHRSHPSIHPSINHTIIHPSICPSINPPIHSFAHSLYTSKISYSRFGWVEHLLCPQFSNLYYHIGSIYREAMESSGEELRLWSPKALGFTPVLPCDLGWSVFPQVPHNCIQPWGNYQLKCPYFTVIAQFLPIAFSLLVHWPLSRWSGNGEKSLGCMDSNDETSI